VKRCFDYRVINRLAGVRVAISRDFYYLVDGENLWTFEPYKNGYRIHANMITKRGKEAISSAKEAIKWMFNQAEVKKIYASVPISNKQSRMLVRHCMEFVNKDAKYHYYEASHV
jgi:hypothetical protein